MHFSSSRPALKIDRSVVESDVQLEDCRIRIQKAGNGPPVILLHGLMGGSFCWRFTLPALARDYTVYAIDLPGVSPASEAAPDADYSVPAQARRVLRLIEHLGLTSVGVIGCSFGGGVALHLALEARRSGKKSLRAMVLVAPVNPWSRMGRGRIGLINTWPGTALARRIVPRGRALLPLAIRRLYGDRGRIGAGTIEGYAPLIVNSKIVPGLLGTLRTWGRDVDSLREALGEIVIPVLLIQGTADRAVDPRSCEELAKRLPNCECIRLQGVGHMPFEETPEKFNRVVMGFLSRNDDKISNLKFEI
jgi:pimeloyl-ACP methyl ester carboxylesterase